MTEQTGNSKPNEAEALAFPLSGNEKLIEETAKAIMEASHGEGEWEFREPIEEELYLRRARAALAVFEKALTPTDDERKAIAQVILPVFDQLASAVYGDGPYSEAESALEAADLLSAAGFRRSEARHD